MNISHNLKLCFFISFILIFTACSSTEESINMGMPLRITTNVAGLTSRAAVELNSMLQGTSMGVYMVDKDGVSYDDVIYNNIQCTTNDGVVWSPVSEIIVTNIAASLYGYWPYYGGISDITKIPISSGEIDYMYATPIKNITKDNPNVTFFLNHALACVRVNIIRGTYTGSGTISEFSMVSNGFSTNGFLNAITGEVTASVNQGVFTKVLSTIIGDEGHCFDVLVIPTNISSDIDFTLLIDNTEYYVTAENVHLQSGEMFEIELIIEPTV